MIPPHWEKNLEKARAAGECIRLDHGWDESKSIYELTDEEIQTAAEFRGGKFLGLAKDEDAATDFRKPCAQYLWECEHGHRFTASRLPGRHINSPQQVHLSVVVGLLTAFHGSPYRAGRSKKTWP